MSQVALGSEPAMEPGSGWIGIWRMVAVVVDGKDLPVGNSTVMEVTPEGYTVKVNGQFYQRGTGRLHPGTSPLELDGVVTEGKHAGKIYPQIQKVEGNVLIGCSAEPGEPRPTTFDSSPGSGRILSVWIRDDKALRLSRRGDGRWTLLAILPILFIADDVRDYEMALQPTFGRWGSLLAIGLGLAAIELVICLLLKWGWRRGIAMGITLALFVLVDKELTQAIEPALGHSGSVIVALSTGLVASFLAWLVTARLLKVEG